MASASQTSTAPKPFIFAGRGGFFDRYFYFGMSLLAAVVVVAGFSQTVDTKLFYPAIAPPKLLWLHGIVFSSWIVFYIVQSALVRTRNVRWHRFLGWAGVGLASIMVPLGVATGIVMVHFETYRLHERGRYAFLAIPLFDIGTFAVCFALAIWWRKKPEFHRRLLLFSTAALLVAAFARVDHAVVRVYSLQYFCADLFIALGIVRDLMVNRRIHSVYKAGLPVYFVAQLFVIYLSRIGPGWWIRIAHAIVG